MRTRKYKIVSTCQECIGKVLGYQTTHCYHCRNTHASRHYVDFPIFGDFDHVPGRVLFELSDICSVKPLTDSVGGWISCVFERPPESEIELVGAHAFIARGKSLYSFATWVSPRFQGQGWGTRLWARSFRLHEITRVHVTTCSESGSGLVRSLREQFRGRVRFSIDALG